ncbi:hypothetical protein PGB90_006934 [Kerria lacca]
MCTNTGAIVRSEILKVPAMGTESVTPENGSIVAANVIQPFDQYRLHLYSYALQAERLRFVQNYPVGNPICPTFTPYGPRWAFPMSLFQNRLSTDEPKPQHSYIGLIAMAILSSPESKLVLSDIYQYILDNYPYFRTRGPGWRNSIRHNLSLNDCFIKAGRSANGKGHYWAIHPANIEDFKKGDFRRRKAQRKVRKHMGLAVDDDGNDSPSPPPITPPPNMWPSTPVMFPPFPTNISRKRQFDVASLLAPDENPIKKKQSMHHHSSSSGDEDDTADIDVVAGDSNTTHNSPVEDGSLSNSSSNSQSTLAPWCYPTILQTSSSEHQQLVAKYYEQLNQARTIQLYQQLQMQRRFCTMESGNSARIEELDNSG